MKSSLVNASKYVSIMIMNIFFVLWYTSRDPYLKAIYIIVGILTSIFCLAWDFYIDWGLFRSTAPDRKYLRAKLLLPKWFYYFGIVSNTILRFMWILQIVLVSNESIKSDHQLSIFILSVAEGFRRAQWTILRV